MEDCRKVTLACSPLHGCGAASQLGHNRDTHGRCRTGWFPQADQTVKPRWPSREPITKPHVTQKVNDLKRGPGRGGDGRLRDVLTPGRTEWLANDSRALDPQASLEVLTRYCPSPCPLSMDPKHENEVLDMLL